MNNPEKFLNPKRDSKPETLRYWACALFTTERLMVSKTMHQAHIDTRSAYCRNQESRERNCISLSRFKFTIRFHVLPYNTLSGD